MAQVSKRVRELMVARLRNVWAAKLAEALDDGGYQLPQSQIDKLAQIDWTGAVKKQFFQGQIDLRLLEDSTSVAYPVVMLAITDIQHDGEEKFVTYSGSANASLAFIVTWPNGSAIPDFEGTLDLIEDTLIAVFHDKNWLGYIGDGVTYRGEHSSTRGLIDMDGQNWTQTITTQMRFGVDV